MGKAFFIPLAVGSRSDRPKRGPRRDVPRDGCGFGRVPAVAASFLVLAALSVVAVGGVVYVNQAAQGPAHDGTSWSTAYLTVSDGLDAAQPGDEIWVAAGTYTELINLRNGVALYGGFAGTETARDERAWTVNLTVLDGGGLGSVVTASNATDAATCIDGFVIRNGRAARGAGVYCTNSSPTISHNVVTQNSASDKGGGVFCEADAAPRVTDNAITGNSASIAGGGIACEGRTFLTILDNSITDNTAGNGGGVYCHDGAVATISSNTITGNSASGHGGGIFCDFYCTLAIAGNAIIGNASSGLGGGAHFSNNCDLDLANNVVSSNAAPVAGGGLSITESCTGTVANNIVSGNSSDYGGGIACARSGPAITNNTLTGNTGTTQGGGLSFSEAGAVVANNIIASNSSGVYGAGVTLPALRNNCLFNNTAYAYSGVAGPTDIAVDPKFVNYTGGNLHIRPPDSPCIDAGDSSVVQRGQADMDQQTRIQGAAVDIGADESDGTVWQPQLETSTDSLVVAEGSTASFLVRLRQAPPRDVRVLVYRASGDANISVRWGPVLTFTTSNWSTFQAVTVASGEDADAIDGVAVVRLAPVGWPTVDITVRDQDNDRRILTDVDAVAVPEGGTASFGVKLQGQPSAPVTVTVSRLSGDTDLSVSSGTSLTFTPANWATYQRVTLAAADDADSLDGTAVFRCSAAGWTSADVTASELDDDSLILTDIDTVSVPEGSTAVFRVKLSRQPGTDVVVTVAWQAGDTDISVSEGGSLTFTAADWDTYQTVTLAAAEDADAIDGTATIRCSAPGWTTADVTAYEGDNDKEIETDRDEVTVPEGATATFQVRLKAEPASDVVVSVARTVGDADISVTGGTSLTFTPANWSIYQTVTLSAAEDADAIEGVAVIRCSAPGWVSRDVLASELDNDKKIVTDKNSVIVPEGETASFFVRLNGQPSESVIVFVSRVLGDTDITVEAGAWLTFTPDDWDIPQQVTLAAAPDPDAENGEALVRCFAPSWTPAEVAVAERERFHIITDKEALEVPEGGAATIRVWLSAQPPADLPVTVTRTSGDPNIYVKGGGTLLFTPDNWAAAQTATIAAGEDAGTSDKSAVVSFASAWTTKEVQVTERDNDRRLVTDRDFLILHDGQTQTFQVKLGGQPTADVTVSVTRSVGSPNVVVASGGTLLFTASNWDVYQAVTVKAKPNPNGGSINAIIRCSAPDWGSKEVAVVQHAGALSVSGQITLDGIPVNGFTVTVVTRSGVALRTQTDSHGLFAFNQVTIANLRSITLRKELSADDSNFVYDQGLAGTVLLRGNGVVSAAVRLKKSGGTSARTDDLGAFVLRKPAKQAIYTLVIRKKP